MRKFIGVLLFLLGLICPITVVVLSVQFGIHCSGHMKLAAHANTVELAKIEMQHVVTYLQEQGMTNGFTSVLWQTPDEDVGFFYNNMVQSLAELNKETTNSTTLEKSNMLMKLRETLSSHGEGGTYMVHPDSLSQFPHNKAFVIWGWCSVLLILIGIFTFLMGVRNGD